jgi:hypothetical protein
MQTKIFGGLRRIFVYPDFSCFPEAVAIKTLPEARLPDAIKEGLW